MLGRFKAEARALIGKHRRSTPVAWAHSLASFVESAYANEGSSFADNGERSVLERLAPASFGTAFDVGANHGDWLLGAVSRWPHCEIHAFEVAPRTFERLHTRIASRSDRGRITLNNLGLSDVTGVQPMFYFPDHPELTCDIARHDGLASVTFDARLDRGDAYLAAHAIERLDFLKIDVEGAEHRVLKGLTRALGEGRVQCIQFEYGAFSTQTRVLLADYYALLQEHFWIGKIYPTYVDFRDYEWTMEDFRFANFCAVLRRRADLKALLAS
jgi:FkbM family methyltransferase